MKRFILYGLTLLLCMTFIEVIPAHSAANDFEFQVEPILPDSQIGEYGYFHLNATVGETIPLQAKVTNNSDQDMTILIRSMDAYSGSQGILYQEKAVLAGSSITNELYHFKQSVSHPEEVALSPKESKVVDFAIETPPVEGTLLGSLSFQVFKGTDSLTSENEGSQLLIDQYRAINLGVQLDVTPIAETLSLVLSPPDFSPEQISILVPLENPQPAIINQVSGDYEVTKEDDPSFVMDGEIPPFKMAPLTKFDFPINWTSESPPNPGSYTVAATVEVNGEPHSYNETVVIESIDITEANDAKIQRGEIEDDSPLFHWAYLLIGVLVIVILVLIGLFFFYIRKLKKTQTPS